MSDRTTYDVWSLDDIHDYLQESMAQDVRDQFEQQLSHDPLLQDALDGIAAHAKIHVKHHYGQLKEQIGGSSDRSGLVISPMSWRIAAGLMLLIVAGGAAYYLYPQMISDDAGTMAQVEHVPEQRADYTNHNSRVVMANGGDSAPMAAMSAVADSLDLTSQPQVLSDGEHSLTYTEERKEGARAIRPPTKSSSPLSSSASKGGVMRGYVTDEHGVAIAGVSVYFPNNQVTVKTDPSGGFAVDLMDTDSTAMLSRAGYKTASDKVRFDRVNTLSLSPDPQAIAAIQPDEQEESAELMIDATSGQALSAMEDKAVEPAVRYGEAHPEKGRRKYAKYVKRQLKYPTAARLENVEGQVVLQFKVKKDGTLFDIRVIQSLGYGCDAEAIRLLSEGPRWIVAEGSEIGRGSYTFKFER